MWPVCLSLSMARCYKLRQNRGTKPDAVVRRGKPQQMSGDSVKTPNSLTIRRWTVPVT